MLCQLRVLKNFLSPHYKPPPPIPGSPWISSKNFPSPYYSRFQKISSLLYEWGFGLDSYKSKPQYFTFLIPKTFTFHTEIMYHFVYKCIQNLSQILTNFCIHFVYKIKRTMKVKLCISLSKCRIHFVYVLYTSILVYEKCTLYKLCIQFVCKMHPTFHHI